MPPSWIFLAVASALTLGFYDISKKIAVHENAALPVLLLSSIAGFLLLLPVYVFSASGQLSPAHSFFVRSLTPVQHGLILIKAGIVTASWVCSFIAIKHLPISVATPLRASSPVFTLLGAILLFAEVPTSQQWVAIALIFGGYFGLSRVGKKEGISFEANRHVWLLLLATAIGATSGLYDKYLLQSARLPATTLQFWFTLYNVGIQALLVGVLWWPRRMNTTPFRFVWTAPLVGVLLVFADQFYFRALEMDGALVGVISVTRRSNVIISFLVGGLLLKEELLLDKAKMVALVFVGLMVLIL